MLRRSSGPVGSTPSTAVPRMGSRNRRANAARVEKYKTIAMPEHGRCEKYHTGHGEMRHNHQNRIPMSAIHKARESTGEPRPSRQPIGAASTMICQMRPMTTVIEQTDNAMHINGSADIRALFAELATACTVPHEMSPAWTLGDVTNRTRLFMRLTKHYKTIEP